MRDPLVNPTITEEDQWVTVVGSINTHNHFTLDPDGESTIYDKDWHTISVQSLSGLHPKNLNLFKMSSASANVWLEVGVQATAETMPNPGRARR